MKDYKTILQETLEKLETARVTQNDYLLNNAEIEHLLDYIYILQKENKILKENAENNDKVVDKVNWENQLLKKENKQLKVQIKEYQKALDETMSEKIDIENNWNKLRECLNDVMNSSEDDDKDFVGTILDIMREIEQGSDRNE